MIFASVFFFISPLFSSELKNIRNEVIRAESQFLDSPDSLPLLNKVLQLQKKERVLISKRLRELEESSHKIEGQITVVSEIAANQAEKTSSVISRLHFSRLRRRDASADLSRDRALQNLARLGILMVRKSKADLEATRDLKLRQENERAELEQLSRDSYEQEEILRISQRIRFHSKSMIQREEALARMKSASERRGINHRIESLVEKMEVRRELATFPKIQMELPLEGTVVSRFGNQFSPEAQMQVFQKGIEIQSSGSGDIKAPLDGKVVFSGELPGIGNTIILDHGQQVYALIGRLGKNSRAVGEKISRGMALAPSMGSNSKVYFELRHGNIPVDPLRWLAKASNL